MKLSLIIPVYNEAACVTDSAARLRSALGYLRKTYNIEVILVDDGSQDGTQRMLNAAFADVADVKIISHIANQGVGAALRTGFDHADGDVIITTDFDGTYPFNAIPQLVARMIVDQADVVVASPYHPNGSVHHSTGHHVILEGGVSLLYRLFVNRHVHTWTSLFCAYRRYVVERVPFNSDNALASTELLVRAMHAGYKVSELPINLHERASGRSRISAIKLSFAHILHLSKLPGFALNKRAHRVKTAANQISSRSKETLVARVTRQRPTVKDN
jgi:dolichol-phosphate mannosyltransferase